MFAVALLFFAQAQYTDLVFVRHGETVANATGTYNSKTIDTFSDLGKTEVSDLTGRLVKSTRFQAIYVSPSPRVLYTIAPYLRATHQRATIWPLLYECCTGPRPKYPSITSFSYGAKIKIPSDLAGLFVIAKGEDRYPVSSSYNAGLAQVEASLKEFREKCRGQRVLLVGHSGHGGQFLHSIIQRWIRLDNAKEFEFRIQ